MTTAPHSFGKALFELLSSMRFAISLLSILAVASIVGTVLKQAEPYNNYLIQFGPYWFEVFRKLGLYDVYHAGWFLLILTFLVASTSVCIWRNAPNFAREMKSFREHVSDASLAAFKHQHEAATELAPQALAANAQAYLAGHGYKAKILPREDGVLLAAKAGSWNRLRSRRATFRRARCRRSPGCRRRTRRSAAACRSPKARARASPSSTSPTATWCRNCRSASR